jgi:hypothetical protein
MLREFTASLREFSAKDVLLLSTDTLQEAAQVASEAVVLGNAFGPGVPLDTGFLRASFRVSKNAPEDGPSVAPSVPGRKDGDPPLYPASLDTSAAQRAFLGDRIFCTTVAEYADPLENNGLTRRNGPPENVGASTEFVRPVEARWEQIVDDAARRVGYGR